MGCGSGGCGTDLRDVVEATRQGGHRFSGQGAAASQEGDLSGGVGEDDGVDQLPGGLRRVALRIREGGKGIRVCVHMEIYYYLAVISYMHAVIE